MFIKILKNLCWKESEKKIKKIYLGKILNSWGLKGYFKIKSFCDIPEEILKFNPVSIEGISEKKSIKIIKKINSFFIIEIEDMKSLSDNEKIKGSLIFKFENEFPTLDKEEYYFFELLSLNVLDEDKKQLGKITNVGDFGGGIFLEIFFIKKNKTELIPFTKKNILCVNKKDNFIILSSSFIF